MKVPIPKFLEDLAVISKLGDNPGADNGLTADGLKAKFDEAVLRLQSFINDTLVESINSMFSVDAPPHEGMNMTGPINMNQQTLGNLKDPINDGDAVNKAYVDTIKSNALLKSGGKMTGAVTTKGIILTEGVDYGDNLPSTVTPGKLFLKPRKDILLTAGVDYGDSLPTTVTPGKLFFLRSGSGNGGSGSNNIAQYTGDYQVTPTTSRQTLETSQKILSDDITVQAIPFSSVENSSGGTTVTIGNGNNLS